MKTRILVAAIAATAAGATPALADFFIVREGPSGPCRVVETRPTDTKIVVVGNKAHKVRAEAEKELAVVCSATTAGEAKECFFDGATNRVVVCEGKAWR
jgi:hypothetical protein